MKASPVILAIVALSGIAWAAQQTPPGDELTVTVRTSTPNGIIALSVDGVAASEMPAAQVKSPVRFVVHGTAVRVIATATSSDAEPLYLTARRSHQGKQIGSGTATGGAVSVAMYQSGLSFHAVPRALAVLLRRQLPD